ncbi:hypothetical protein LMG33818_001687 [Halomonadaceae bacterium LMG 33818]|uniref:hypothetical protein n=1 Tax=Cernens ardua TaxID=3402176 RepID=UPI003EDC1EC1
MSGKLLSSVALVMGMALAVVCTQAYAQTPSTDTSQSHALVQQCLQQAQAKDGKTFHSNMVASTNISRYVAHQPFRLTVSLEGQGNAFFNISCHVDTSGQVSYQGYGASGMPLD